MTSAADDGERSVINCMPCSKTSPVDQQPTTGLDSETLELCIKLGNTESEDKVPSTIKIYSPDIARNFKMLKTDHRAIARRRSRMEQDPVEGSRQARRRSSTEWSRPTVNAMAPNAPNGAKHISTSIQPKTNASSIDHVLDRLALSPALNST